MDSRKKKVLSVLIIGSLILLWRMTALVKYLPSRAEATSADTIPEESGQGSDGDRAHEGQDDGLAEKWKAQQRVAEQPWGRDPFADVPWAARDVEQADDSEVGREDEPPPEPPAFQFTGVCRSGRQWLAIVQGRIVRVGDVIDEEFTVVEITKNTMTLECRGHKFRCELGAEEARALP